MTDRGREEAERICSHCKTDIAIRNLSGFCDHLYYPEACKVCAEQHHAGCALKCSDCLKEYQAVIAERDAAIAALSRARAAAIEEQRKSTESNIRIHGRQFIRDVAYHVRNMSRSSKDTHENCERCEIYALQLIRLIPENHGLSVAAIRALSQQEDGK